MALFSKFVFPSSLPAVGIFYRFGKLDRAKRSVASGRIGAQPLTQWIYPVTAVIWSMRGHWGL